MIYVHRHTIPPNTEESDPLEYTLKLTYGIIHKVSIGFPRGCSGLAHLKIFRLEHQIFPTNTEGSFAFDGTNIEWQDHYEILGKPYNVLLVGWNNDTLFAHTITVRLAIVEHTGLLISKGTVVQTEQTKQGYLLPEYY